MSEAPISSLPTGTVTFLFTDIEGCTKRWEQYPQEMNAALARHDEILRQAIEANGGYIFKTVGDAFCAAFPTAPQALRASLDAQITLLHEGWPETIGQVRVKMALHVGAAEERGGDYFGQPVNRVARLLSAGHGSQVLLSDPAYDLVRDNLPAGVSVRDLGEHRLKDLIRPERVFQLVAPNLATEFPPLKTLENRPNNLPVQATPFIGREKEVTALCALLRRPDVRLVTLIGPGGTGKTRLGLQVAAELLDDFQDGVFAVELATLLDPSLVPSTIAQALGVAEASGKLIVESIKEYLKDRQLLLMLDNFEQVSQAAPVVDALLKGAGNLNVMVTSRLGLRLYGEKEFQVPPLELPDPAHLPSVERLTQYDAVRLFIERAQDVKSDFEVTNDNAPAVAEICVRLDGLPLAIELAAARVRLFPPAALLSRLSNRLKMLTGGAHNLPARQQTLRNTIEWSYDLLDDGEKQLFTRMAVFQGGRTLEALEAVCNADSVLQVDVMDGVGSLMENSLLRQGEGRDGEPRFVILETIHEYAREKMEESGEAGELRRQHAAYFLTVALALAEKSGGTLAERVAMLDQLEDEHDNMRAALDWAVENDIGLGLRLVAMLGRLWETRGYHTEGRERISRLLSHLSHPEASASEHREARAKLLLSACRLASEQADYDAVRLMTEESLAICRELDDKGGMADALSWLAFTTGEKDKVQALSLYEESLALYRELDRKGNITTALTNIGWVFSELGDTNRARSTLEEGLAINRELGNDSGIAFSLENLGEVAYEEGDYGRARSCWEESLLISRALDIKHRTAVQLHHLGYVEHQQGNLDLAFARFAESLRLCREHGFKDIGADCLAGLAVVAGSKSQAALAARLFGASEALRERNGYPLRGPDRVDYDGNVAAARAQLDAAAWGAAWEAGRVMSIEQAIEYALEKTTA